ncbi:Moenomycin biosynthesis protein MoeN5 [Streptomyces sp. DH41]|uniref:Moenomycin biosynthesis protein MoeN5 n=1 Tax=Streptomyces sp. DH41 TaxID=3040125 RepID=UPI0024436FD8|nr:Moenomycin biosynthesis protein MoeN5 [Streptomyces sp. DH41]MDG9726991.1 Moenomycin biosynthesis protein MoeN5 [Streptomyces sp. DH41]
MTAAPVTALPAHYTESMLAAEAANRDHVTRCVAGTGGSPDLVAHTAALRLYLRVPHFLTEWTTDPDRRAAVSRALALDIVSMKLLDDLMDDDTGLDRVELACVCLRLHLRALHELACLAREPKAVTDILERDAVYLCGGQIGTKRSRATNLQEWRAHASTYGAAFLGRYGALAAACGSDGQPGDAVRQFAEAFALIITTADDLTDYDRNGERDGNLAHLMRTGAVPGQDVVDQLEELRGRALTAVTAAPGLVPVVHLYTDDVLTRLVPRHL